MIEGIHKHLLSELDRAGRSDTVFVLAGSAFNTLIMFINWAQADGISRGRGNIMLFLLFVAGALLVTGASLLVLLNSRRICVQCHEALSKIYNDTCVSQYMPPGMTSLGNKRFILSFIVVASTGALAVAVPFISISPA
jgi:hypothetical protein